uniref:Uncharacterized protein n=1 Tax=Octopus bimaculoides TaxID=37653 RepID=A0A0L8IFY6_OCTBM
MKLNSYILVCTRPHIHIRDKFRNTFMLYLHMHTYAYEHTHTHTHTHTHRSQATILLEIVT